MATAVQNILKSKYVTKFSQLCLYCWVRRTHNFTLPGNLHQIITSSNPSRQVCRNYVNYAGEDSLKKNFFLKFGITKDRLILLGIGVLVAGGLVGYEKNVTKTKQYRELLKRLHATVLSAQSHVNEGDYENALLLYRQAHGMVDQVTLSSETVQKKVLLNIVDQLGHLAYALDDWKEAEVFLKETEKIMLEYGIEKDDDVYIEVQLRLAKIDVINSRQQEALDRFHFCIENYEGKISVKDMYAEPETEAYERITLYGLLLTEYGTYTKELGLLDDSEKAFSKALNICRSVLGPTHEQTSVLANDLATVYDEKGRYNKAIRLAEKAIRIASETAPENLATFQYNLGHILMHKGDMGRARKALREALKLAEENEDSETKKLAESSIMKLDINQ